MLPLPPAGTFANPALKESDFQVALEQLLAALAEAQGDLALPEVPVATVFSLASATLPPGYLWCRGGLESRTTYAALFGALGTIYGAGDGSSTFGLPDLRGRSPVGFGDSGLLPTYNVTLGTKLGENAHPLTAAEMPTHGHTVTDPTHQHAVYDPGHGHAGTTLPITVATPGSGAGYFPSGGGVVENRAVAVPAAGTGIGVYAVATGISIANAGGGGAHNVMHPVLGLNFIIKT